MPFIINPHAITAAILIAEVRFIALIAIIN
jgi:hypothetical protein